MSTRNYNKCACYLFEVYIRLLFLSSGSGNGPCAFPRESGRRVLAGGRRLCPGCLQVFRVSP